MKTILISLLVGLVLIGCSGCATDKYYNTAKTIYVGGRAVVIQNADMLPKSTLEKLKKIDEYAKRYDNARKLVKKSIAVDTNLSSKNTH